MTENELQARLIIQHGLLPQSKLEPFYRLAANTQRDLASLLGEQGLLRPEQISALRQQLVAQQSARLSRSSAMPALSEQELTLELSKALSRDPWFEPHSEWLWERREKLGEGGMGSIWRVRDRRLGRDGALKLLLAESDENALERFLREAKITARLDHPSIPPIYEAGKTASGQHYIVMKVVEGQTLRERIDSVHKEGQGHPDELRTLLRALVKVGEAVSYAHSQGIIHRDLKPDNVMIGRFGEVLVLDWGIAKDSNDSDAEKADRILKSVISKQELSQAGLTVSGSMLGTPGYMSPEQIVGVSGKESDVFSLGVMLTELLTGQEAISGDSALEKVAATASGGIRSPREIHRNAPKELDCLAQEAMAIEVEERLESVEAFVKNLEAYLSGIPLSVYQYSLREKIFRWSAKRPDMIVTMAALILVLSVTFGLYSQFVQSEQARETAETEADKAKLNEARLKGAVQKTRELELAVKRGSPKKQLLEGVDEALELGRDSYAVVLSLAKICGSANLRTRELELIKNAANDFYPAYEALFLWHQRLISDERGGFFAPTEPLYELNRRAKKLGDENEFTMCIEALEYFESGDNERALLTLEPLEKYSTSFSWAYSFRATMKSLCGDEKGALDDFEIALKSDPGNAIAHMNLGRLKFLGGDPKGALECYNTAIKFDPSLAVAYSNRGVVKDVLKDAVGALEDFNRAISIDPQRSQLFNQRGASKFSHGDEVGALVDYNQAISLDPKNDRAYYNRGRFFHWKGELRKALNDYNRGIEINKKSVSLFVQRGIVKQLLKDAEGAFKDLTKAIELDPKAEAAYRNRALIYYQRGEWQRTLDEIALGLEATSKSAELYRFRAQLRNDRGEMNEAIADFNKALEIKANYAAVYCDRGTIYLNQNKLSEALKDYNQAIKLDKTFALAFLNRASLFSKIGRDDLALKDLDRTIELDPSEAGAFYDRGCNKEKGGRVEEALKDYEKALELNPNHALALHNIGLISCDRGQMELAIRKLNRVIQIDPKLAKGYSGRAYLRVKQKKWQAAVDDYSTAISLNPNDADAYYGRSIAYNSLNNREAVQRDLERAVSVNPRLSQAQYNLAVLKANRNQHKEAAQIFEIYLSLNPGASDGAKIRRYIRDYLGRRSKY